MRSRTLLLALAAAVLLGATPVLAQSATPIATTPSAGAAAETPGNPFAERGATLPGVMRWLQSEEIPLIHIGDEGGVKGYLGEAANGRYQTFYPAPDGEHVMSGILFQAGGRQITRDQVTRMFERFGEAARNTPGADLSSLPEIPELDTTAFTVDKPIMDYLRESGLKVTDLNAAEGGVKAYLVETKPAVDGTAGKMQMFYVLPNDRYAVAGVLLRRGGVNVTGLQIGFLQQRFITQQQVDQMTGSAISTGPKAPDVPNVSLNEPTPVDGASLEAPAAPTTTGEKSVPQLLKEAEAAIAADSVSPAPTAPVTSAQSAPGPVFPNTPISTKPETAAAPFLITDVTGEQFIEAVNDTVYFSAGLAGRPAIYMVADPQCPFCHEAWRTLKTMVFDGKIQVRVIMIAGLKGSDPLARSILSHTDPSGVWLAGQGSIQGTRIDPGPAVGSSEWNRAGQFLQINANFINRFNITQTPFLAYVTPEGKLYANRGVPSDFDAFLAALK